MYILIIINILNSFVVKSVLDNPLNLTNEGTLSHSIFYFIFINFT